MSLKTLNVDERHLYWYLAITLTVGVMIAWLNHPPDIDDLESRVQTLEAAMDATQCGCPEGGGLGRPYRRPLFL